MLLIQGCIKNARAKDCVVYQPCASLTHLIGQDKTRASKLKMIHGRSFKYKVLSLLRA